MDFFDFIKRLEKNSYKDLGTINIVKLIYLEYFFT